MVRLTAVVVMGWLAWSAAPAALRASDTIPAPPQREPIALVGGTLHPVSGPPIENGTLLMDRGRIVALGRDLRLPAGTRTIDVRGQHVYPGLIDAYTQLGLVEVGAVRASVDDRETGSVNPSARAITAFNPDSEHLPVTRANGVLVALVAPRGGLLSGTSAVVQLDGWTWEDMALKTDAAMHVEWPAMAPTHTWWLEASPAGELSTRDRSLRALQTAFVAARQYQRLQAARREQGLPPADHDQRWEAMLPVLERRMPLVVYADEVQQIQTAIALAARHEVRLVIYGGYDAPACTALLKQYDVPVVLRGVNRLPQRRGDPYDAPFTVPARLHKAGIRFCIADRERLTNERNLPYHAATAVAYGLPHDAGLRSITLSAAEILGVADRVGSLEAGKDATLIVTSGDPLEISTQVNRAFVQGRELDLTSRHTRLWRKYQEKYRQQDGAAAPANTAAEAAPDGKPDKAAAALPAPAAAP